MTDVPRFSTREEWLMALIGELRPWYDGLPEVRVSVGFTSAGARSKRVGECWAPECDATGRCQLFVHPSIHTELGVAAVLAHELIHAAIGVEKKHGAEFKRVAHKIGLEGKMWATTPGPAFINDIQPLLLAVGPYPHAPLKPGKTVEKKQTTRMIKAECPECGYTFRTTWKWLNFAAPVCPAQCCEDDGERVIMAVDLGEQSEDEWKRRFPMRRITPAAATAGATAGATSHLPNGNSSPRRGASING